MATVKIIDYDRPVGVIKELDPAFLYDGVQVQSGVVFACIGGKSRVFINSKPVQMSPGRVVLVRPGDTFKDTNLTQDYEVKGFYFNKAIIEAVQARDFVKLLPSGTTIDDPRMTNMVIAVAYLIDQLLPSVSDGCLSDMMVCCLKAFIRLAHEIVSETDPMNSRQHRKHEIFNLFYSSLVAHCKEERSPGYYAKQLGISTKYLNDASNFVAGKTSKEVIDDLVTIKLQIELRNTKTPLKEIAYNYHFSSIAFFCNYFKRHTGTTPQEYRRTLTLR